MAGTAHLRFAIGAASLCLCFLLDLLYFPPHTIFGDEQRYLASAVGIAKNLTFSVYGDVAWEMPGAAIFFAPFVYLFGPEQAVIPIRLFQAALLLVQALLIGQIAGRIFRDNLAGLMAYAMVALYPFFLYYQGLVLSETLFNTFLIAAFASLYRWRDRGMKFDGSFVITCACFALATYTKATLTILPPLLIALATIAARDRWLTGKVLAVSSVVYLTMLTPWVVRNYYLLNAFVPFTTSATLNLYLGNNPKNLDGGADWNKNVDRPAVNAMHGLPNETDRQRAFGEKAVQHIASDPTGFVYRAAQKFIRFWNVIPNAAEFNSGPYRIISAASFGPILFLSLACLWMHRRRLSALAPLLLLIGYFTAIHSITIASLRYRLPLEPFLIVLASWPAALINRSSNWFYLRARIAFRSAPISDS